jgi:hypothetical protein
MSEIEQLHEQAIDLAEEAFAAQRKSDAESAKNLFLRALELEVRAASTFPATAESEPTRSILYRSAAALAYHAKEYDRAEQLIAFGLSGFPPIEIKEELRALQDDVNFRHHIAIKNAELPDNQMQIMLWGDATGHGVIPVDILLTRVNQIKTIFYRTVERLLKFQYRTSGPPSQSVTNKYSLYLNAFSSGSFGVSFSIGEPVEQLELPFGTTSIPPKNIVDEVITCYQLLENGDLDALKNRIPDNNYYQNFIGISKQIAPDGNDIKVFSIASNDKSVTIRKNRKDMPSLTVRRRHTNESRDNDRVRLEGFLKVADNLKTDGRTGRVQIIDKEKRTYTIRVPVSQMQDVVQPYFDKYVIITGRRRRKSIFFEDIEIGDINQSKAPSTRSPSADVLSLPDLLDK